MTVLETLKMDKTHFSIALLDDETDEVDFWRTQSHQARMEALEFMRQVMYGYDPSATRLQRSIEIVERGDC